jgi:hypothetical protein
VTRTAPPRRRGRLARGLVVLAGLVVAGCAHETARSLTGPTPTVSFSSTPLPGRNEAGGGGATFPQRALNDPWGLSVARANCMLCHRVDPGTDPTRFNAFGKDWRRALFERTAPGSDDIFDPTQPQREAASTDPELLAADSDGDGYTNRVELTFGSDPSNPRSHSSRSPAQLTAWADRLPGRAAITAAERQPWAATSGPDRDGDRVPDELEEFAGTDPTDPRSTPLTAARRLAALRGLLDPSSTSPGAPR